MPARMHARLHTRTHAATHQLKVGTPPQIKDKCNLHLCPQVTTCHHDAVCCLHDGIKVLQAVVRLKLGDKLNLVADA
jgi:hypothetical protein